MASYHGPKAKKMRRFGELLIPRPKYARILEGRAYPPGQHGREKAFRSGRRGNYSLQLDEKQKLAFIYNVRERQIRNYYTKANKMSGPTGANLLSLLERRLDNLVYRAGFAATIWAARQLVTHGHILVNGKRINLPSYNVQSGDQIELHDRMKRNVHVEEWVDQIGAYPVYLDVNKDKRVAKLNRLPDASEIQIPVDIQLVVEYYNRLT